MSTTKKKLDRLREDKDSKMLGLKGSFFDIQKAMYNIENQAGAGSQSAYLRSVMDIVDDFKQRVREYISAEDAIIVAMSDPGPRSDAVIPSPAELTGKPSNAPWGEFPEATEESAGGDAPGTPG
jgi:hypothetical protein